MRRSGRHARGRSSSPRRRSRYAHARCTLHMHVAPCTCTSHHAHARGRFSSPRRRSQRLACPSPYLSPSSRTGLLLPAGWYPAALPCPLIHEPYRPATLSHMHASLAGLLSTCSATSAPVTFFDFLRLSSPLLHTQVDPVTPTPLSLLSALLVVGGFVAINAASSAASLPEEHGDSGGEEHGVGIGCQCSGCRECRRGMRAPLLGGSRLARRAEAVGDGSDVHACVHVHEPDAGVVRPVLPTSPSTPA